MDLGLHESADLLKREFIEIEGVDKWINDIWQRLLVSDKVQGIQRSYGYHDINYDDTSKMLGKILRSEVRKVLSQVRKEMQKRAKTAMHSDPRKAAQAVKMSKWRKSEGGSVSLFNNLKLDKRMAIISARNNRQGKRGGNRLERSDRTNQVDGYFGKDRAFILRFINNGTIKRDTKYGSRGAIGARGFFNGADGVMNTKVGEMTARLEALIREIGE